MITGLPPAPLISGSGGVFASIGSSLTASQDATSVTITPATGNAATIPAATDALAGVLDAERAAVIDNLAVVASSGSYTDLINLPNRTAFMTLMIDGGGAAIVAPITRFIYVPFAGAITGWILMADRSGSISIDVWKEPLSGFPPTLSNSITGGAVMSLTSQTNNSAFPPPWPSLTIDAGDVLGFNVSAAATIQTITAQLVITH
jgi:hypothetical protein